MRTAWLVVLSVILYSIATSSLATIKIDTLYKATVPITTQAPAERAKGIQQALSQVFIKVSGNAQILNNPQLQKQLNSEADTLIQQYSYSAPPKGSTAPYLLDVQFDASGVNQWLRDAGAAIWGQNRPLIIAWIVYEAPGHPAELLGSDSTNGLILSLKKYAEERGLPLMLPVMDVTDINQASVQDVKDMAAAKLINAAKRYANDGILIGRITQDSNGFTSEWKLLFNDKEWGWKTTGKNAIDVVPVLIGNVTNTLAARYAVVTTNTIQKDLTLKVTGITHYSDFAELTRYLTHLTPVASVEITQILPDNGVILKLSLRSSQESFVQALSLGKKLTPTSTPNATDTIGTYQWNP